MPSNPITIYSGSNPAALATSFLGANSGISVVSGSVAVHASAADAINLYDGTLSALGISAGLLLTSGTTPGTENTVGWFGQDNTLYAADGTPTNFYNGDADIDAVVNTVFQTQSYDATTLSFDFTVTDPAATSISFDLVFGSDEYPEWVDQFVDCAVIIVNGVNYALFNHDPNAPLSVIGPNLAAGYFQDNAGNVLPIEYDGVSHVLKIVAPIRPGEVNSIKIGVADTGDHIYDSGIFIANMVAGTTPGSGVVITPDVPCTEGNDIVTGTIADELVTLLGGDDTAYAGGGDDIVVAGAGNDKVYGGTGNDALEGDQGNDMLDGGEGTANQAVYQGSSADFAVTYDATTGKYTVDDNGSDANDEGVDTLSNIQLVKFSDGLFDLTTTGLSAHIGNTGGAVNSPGSVTLSGIALPGHALTAIVTDPNGVPSAAGAVAYQWLTSTDGVTWTDTGVTTKTFTLTDANAGQQVMATAQYADSLGHAELVSSGGLTVAAPGGDFSIQLMALSAPAGATVLNPLTTLLQNAVDLGFTPATAELAIKAALGLPDIDLRTFDAYAALTANPADATALAVIKIATEVAMAASISDPSGYNLALAALQAADQGQVLDLGDAATLATLLNGADANLVDIVIGLNKDMADAGSFATVKLVWNDYAGQTDSLSPYIGHLETLNVHINQAPTGSFSAGLPFGSQDAAYVIYASDLLAGFSDPEGGVLTIASITADMGGTLVDNLDGTFTFTPDAGFSGPVELSFTVSDPEGASVAGSTMLVIEAAAPPADTTAPTATISSDMTGTANGAISFSVTFDEAVNAIDASAFVVTHGTIASIGDNGAGYTVLVTPDAGFEGQVELALPAGAVSDLAGNATQTPASAQQLVDTLAPTVSITDNAAGTAAGPITYTLTFSEAVTGLAATDLAVTHGTVTSVSGSGDTWTVVVTPSAGFEGSMALSLIAGAAQDAAGNGSEAADAAVQTVDTLAPVIASFIPADGSTGIAGATNIAVTFSEGVVMGAGIIAIHAGSPTGAVVESFDAASSTRLSLAGQVLTIDPATTLGAGTQYFVTFASGVVRDLAGNAYAGTTSYDFTTAAAPQPLNLVGTAGADTLTGGALDDTLTGLGGTDSMNGAGGSDLYIIGAANEHSAAEITDTGTSGTDEVRFTASGTSTLTLFAGDSGIELVSAATGTAALSINAAAVLNGLTIVGNAGTNTLTGTGFNDVLIGGAGSDVLNGGNGNDTASYADQSGAVTISLAITKAQNTGAAGSDTLKNIENLIGGSGNDSLTGNASANRIDGGAGNDSIDGSSGADTLLGGAGADTIIGGANGDALWGGTGADTFVFKASADSATADRDTIWDFSHAEGDRIDLHLIDAISGGKDQAFTLVGAFTHAAGQLVASTEGDHYLVQGDINGDGLADFAIAVYSATTLVAGDFAL